MKKHDKIQEPEKICKKCGLPVYKNYTCGEYVVTASYCKDCAGNTPRTEYYHLRCVESAQIRELDRLMLKIRTERDILRSLILERMESYWEKEQASK